MRKERFQINILSMLGGVAFLLVLLVVLLFLNTFFELSCWSRCSPPPATNVIVPGSPNPVDIRTPYETKLSDDILK